MNMVRRSRGVTLTELMIVLAMTVILLAIAVPDLSKFIRQQRLKAASNDLFSAIDLTRSQAIARGSRVVLTPSDPGGTAWDRGWTVFVDRDGDRRPGARDEIIASHGPVPEGIVIRSNFTSQREPFYIAYNGAGRGCTDSSSLSARWGTVSVVQGEQARHIKINMLGRARICDPACESNCSGAGE